MNARSTVDPTVDGRQFGYLEVPTGGSSTLGTRSPLLRTPIGVLRRGEGPMITLISGLFGKAPEATTVLQQLARTIDVDAIHGTLVIIPHIEMREDGPVSECVPDPDSSEPQASLVGLIADHFVNTASVVMSFQSGGPLFGFAPSAAVVQQADRESQSRVEASMIAFGAPNSVRLPSSRASALERMCADAAIPCIRILLGGQGTASADSMDIALRGCHNVFSQSGLTSQALTLCATRMLEVSDTQGWIHAPRAGLYSSPARLGGEVWRGDPLVHLSTLEGFERLPDTVTVPRDSIVLGMRQSGECQMGDCLMLLADEVQR